MAQILIRQVDDDLKDALQRRARANGRSMEEEVREILREAIGADVSAGRRLGSLIAARFRGQGLTQDIPELRGYPARPVDFDAL